MQQNSNDATAKVGKKDVKMYESAKDTENRQKAQAEILKETDIVNYSLSGARLKTYLYALFSVLAALELAAALYFYGASFGMTLYAAIGAAAAFSISFHLLTHKALKKACLGLVFALESHSRAATAEIVLNVIIALVLLSTAAGTVYFIGKPSFEANRRNNYAHRRRP
jgi:hypothetical protein